LAPLAAKRLIDKEIRVEQATADEFRSSTFRTKNLMQIKVCAMVDYPATLSKPQCHIGALCVGSDGPLMNPGTGGEYPKSVGFNDIAAP
jgi:hypothetical protein